MSGSAAAWKPRGVPNLKWLNLRRRVKQTGGTPYKKWKIVRGDLVEVIEGPEEGKQGVVKEVIRVQNRLVVEVHHIASARRGRGRVIDDRSWRRRRMIRATFATMRRGITSSTSSSSISRHRDGSVSSAQPLIAVASSG